MHKTNDFNPEMSFTLRNLNEAHWRLSDTIRKIGKFTFILPQLTSTYLKYCFMVFSICLVFLECNISTYVQNTVYTVHMYRTLYTNI